MILRIVFVMGVLASCTSKKTEPPAQPGGGILSGAARVRGGGVRMDVQIGLPIGHNASVSRPAVKP